jgi:copper chaperone
MQTITFRVEEMHCGGCVRRVSDAILTVPGARIERVDVGTARVSMATDATASAVVAALSSVGFRATIEAGVQHQAEKGAGPQAKQGGGCGGN